MKSLGLIAFLAVGLAVAWFTSNQGMSAGAAFLIAFVPAMGTAYLVDKLASRRARG